MATKQKNSQENPSGMSGAEFTKKLAATGTGQQKLEICRQVLRDRGAEATAEDCYQALCADPMVREFTKQKARTILETGDWKPEDQAANTSLSIEDELLLRRPELDQRKGKYLPRDTQGLTTDRRAREVIGDRERAMALERDLQDFDELAEAEPERAEQIDPHLKAEREEEEARKQDREREVRLANIRERQRKTEATAAPGFVESQGIEGNDKPQFRETHPAGPASVPPKQTDSQRPNPGVPAFAGGPKPDDDKGDEKKADQRERPANVPAKPEPVKPEADPKKAHDQSKK